jgi:hypothetical protein
MDITDISIKYQLDLKKRVDIACRVKREGMFLCILTTEEKMLEARGDGVVLLLYVLPSYHKKHQTGGRS